MKRGKVWRESYSISCFGLPVVSFLKLATDYILISTAFYQLVFWLIRLPVEHGYSECY